MSIQRCYVFAIGGSGARVLEAMTLQLAAGCGYDTLQNWEIVPILIDLDEDNGNTSQTRNLLQNYVEVYKSLRETEGESQFFKTHIKRLKDVSQSAESDSFTMRIDLTNKNNLKQMIDYEGLGADEQLASTQNLVDLLFTDEELEMSLQHGFKGKPNIGSVVFSQFVEKERGNYKNKDFGAFIHGFKEGDRIFVMGSIFGGTGAAGIPWLIKEIRNNPDVEALKDAKIGLLSVMPYFTVSNDPQSKINSNDFIIKTASALQYYHHNLNEPNSIYYIADSNDKMEHANYEGGASQKNVPHLVEFIGATSLIKFLGDDTTNKLDGPDTWRYGLKVQENDHRIYLNHFDPQTPTYRWINQSLTRFYLAHLLLLRVFKRSNSINWKLHTRIIEKIGFFGGRNFDESFFNQPFYKSYERFFAHFSNYFEQLSGEADNSNHRVFAPYILKPNVGERKLDDKSAVPMNEIIRNSDLSNGFDKIDKITKGRDITTYYLSGKTIKWSEFVTLVNSQIKYVNQLVHQDTNTQRAFRLDELLYLGSTQFLEKYKLFTN